MNDLGRYIFMVGLVIAALGLILWSGFGRGWFGQLPGDINVKGDNYSFHFPVVTCIIVSIVLTLLSWLFRK
jgi:hypothetical protein